MTKYKVGDDVYHHKWKAIGVCWPATILGVVPRRWWHIQQRYLINDFPRSHAALIVKEKDLSPR